MLQYFIKPLVLSVLLPQRHPAEGMFEWISRAWALFLTVLAVAQSPLQCRLLDNSSVRALYASMDTAPCKRSKEIPCSQSSVMPIKKSYQEKTRSGYVCFRST